VTIKGRKFWLWRAVDQSGLVLDEVLPCRRNTKAAKRLLVRLMNKHRCAPNRFVTDKLRSCRAVKREIAPRIEHRSHKGLNNQAENSHLPSRKRERVMQVYRSPGNLQRFVSIHSAICNCFSIPTCRRSELTIRYHGLEAFDAWNAATCTT
jgi:putative transposase